MEVPGLQREACFYMCWVRSKVERLDKKKPEFGLCVSVYFELPL